MKTEILVVGGYGHVGKVICLKLGDIFPGKVVAAGRSQQRAKQLSQETAGKVKALRLDIQKAVDPDLLSRFKLVIMCLDQVNPAFVHTCLQSGTHYIDISAKYTFINQVEQLGNIARGHGAIAVLSVGLAPGITNLLASRAVQCLEQTEAIEISIMLGLGDRHGAAAIEWTIDQINASFEVVKEGQKQIVASFTDARTINFGLEIGARQVYRFPFSDQLTLARTLNVPNVATRLCFDSAAVTTIVAKLRAWGITHVFRNHWVRRAAVRAFHKLRFGEDKFAIKIDAWGRRRGKDATIQCMLQGRNQSEMTALAAAFTADTVCRSEFIPGVYHLEQLVELSSMEIWLRQFTYFDLQIEDDLD
ncbi:saccharopine dehydrogenase family protein [Paenibacillus lentus]|uniref:Saccharopine dehydrogenase n=1 Tax=Paenibacillus lentus TaxID=1338368 RepID=A0A3Q8S615_9BACL|nr:saccharopine dehydrogenase NADP-binding domain-containing protein [Paenibacillus lentus]AZK47879.1 saccharopine dehydrogenase [Paenibacillus lentus]